MSSGNVWNNSITYDPNGRLMIDDRNAKNAKNISKILQNLQIPEDQDPDRAPRVYVASKFEDFPRMQRLQKYLWEKDGILITSRWIRGGHDPLGNTDEDSVKYATQDLADLLAADMVVLWNPKSFHGSGRGGRHVELGYALAFGRPVVLVGEPENVFEHLPEVERVPDPDSSAFVVKESGENVKTSEELCFAMIADRIKEIYSKSIEDEK